MSTQPTPAQLLAHAEAELGRLERQRDVMRDGIQFLEVVKDETAGVVNWSDKFSDDPASGSVEKALGSIATSLSALAEYQLAPARLALVEIDTRHSQLTEFIRQQKSPILGASLIPPSGAGFGRRG